MALSYSLFQAPSDSLGVHPTRVRGHRYNSLGKAWRSSLGFSHFLFSVLLQRSVMTESNRPCGSVVPWPITCAARILAEKSLHYFFESYLCGDTSDANTCPSTGMCSSGDGMEWAGRQDQTLPLHCLPVILWWAVPFYLFHLKRGNHQPYFSC